MLYAGFLYSSYTYIYIVRLPYIIHKSYDYILVSKVKAIGIWTKYFQRRFQASRQYLVFKSKFKKKKPKLERKIMLIFQNVSVGYFYVFILLNYIKYRTLLVMKNTNFPCRRVHNGHISILHVALIVFYKNKPNSCLRT